HAGPPGGRLGKRPVLVALSRKVVKIGVRFSPPWSSTDGPRSGIEHRYDRTLAAPRPHEPRRLAGLCETLRTQDLRLVSPVPLAGGRGEGFDPGSPDETVPTLAHLRPAQGFFPRLVARGDAQCLE